MNIPAKYFRRLLVSESTITDISGTRAYEEPIPRKPTYPLLSFRANPSGGEIGPSSANSATYGSLRRVSFRLRCWAQTEAGAYALFAVVHDFLNGLRHVTINGVHLSQIWQEGQEVPFQDGLAEAPVSIQASFSFQIAV